MAINIIYTPNAVKLYDTLLINDSPGTGVLVSVWSRRTGQQIAGTTINTTNGYYSLVIPKDDIPAGIYDIKFYGRGLKPAYPPEGIWETIVIRDANANMNLTITANPGLVCKYSNEIYTPDTITLSANLYNIFEPTFQWYDNDIEIENATDSEYIISSAVAFTSTSSKTYVCVVNGKNIDGEIITPRSASVTIIKVEDGESGVDGPAIVYRGIYDTDKIYYNTNVRRDVVYYDGVYYICAYNETTDVWNPAHWEQFGAQFESVATGLLLAEDAVITRSLILGTEGSGVNHGIIRSVDATSTLVGNGFFLSATEDGTGLFRVGSVNSNTLLKGIYWDGSNLIVKADHFLLDSTGKLWADSGGFGGTADTPALSINSAGLKTGETYIHGNSTWAAPITTTVTGSTNPINWSTSGNVTLAGLGNIIYSSDFSANTNGWTAGNGSTYGNQDNVASYNNTLIYQSNGSFTNVEHYVKKINLNLVQGQSYYISFWYYIPAGQTIVTQGRVVLGDSINDNGEDFTTTGQWTKYSGYITASDSNAEIRIYACNATKTAYYGNASNNFYLYNFEIYESSGESSEFNLNEIDSYVEYAIGITENDVNKTYTYVTYTQGDGGSNNLRHKYEVSTYFENILVKTKTLYRNNSSISSSISESYFPTNAGILKFRLTYKGTEEVETTLQNATD